MTPLKRLSFGAFALVVGLGAAPVLAQDAAHDMAGMDHAVPMEPGSASANYMAAMKTMEEAMSSMTMTGKPGVDYANMMIPHHRSAVEMAKAYLASNDGDPVLTKLSNDIVTSQEAEIAQLENWLKANSDR